MYSDHVNLLAALPNGYLASGSADYTIKIWNTNEVVKYEMLS